MRANVVPLFLPAFLFLVIPGCASYKAKDLVIPESVSVGSALEEIGCAFNRMREAEGGHKVGIIPADMKVTLKVSVSAKDGGKLTVAASTPATVAGGSITGEKYGEANAGRENTIEINFKSLPLYFMDKAASADGKQFTPEVMKSYFDTGMGSAPYFTGPAKLDAAEIQRRKAICDKYS